MAVVKKIQIPEASEAYDIGVNLSNVSDATELQAIEAVVSASASASGFLQRDASGSWSFGEAGGADIPVSPSEPTDASPLWFKVIE